MRLTAERRDADIADALFGVAEVIPAVAAVAAVAEHGFDAHVFAFDRHRLFAAVVRMADGQLQFGVDLTLHAANGFFQLHALRGLVANLDDLIPRQNSRAIGRRIDQRSDHDELVFDQADANANPAEFVFHSGAELLQFLRRNVVRVRIQLAQHALDRRFHQFAAADRLHVIAFHLVERVGEQLQ